jgi:predicted kinase
VVDNTNLTRAARAPVIQIAVESGVPCRAVVLATPLEVALARNAARTGDARVPDGIVRQMAREWEPPSRDEGLLGVFWGGH